MLPLKDRTQSLYSVHDHSKSSMLLYPMPQKDYDMLVFTRSMQLSCHYNYRDWSKSTFAGI